MKQIVQDMRHGDTMLVEAPAPALQRGHVLIRTHFSLVSAGTERMLVEFGRAGWIEKIRSQPEKVHQVISKIKSDGLFPALDAAFRKLDEPIALGYCNAGTVIAVAPDVNDFCIGDRVVSNGPHAEVVCAGRNLVSKIPEEVEMEEAAFAVVAAIALQGIRLVQPQLGDMVVVQGLGLIGQLACQLLMASGCRVIGVDTNAERTDLAGRFGVETALAGEGVDVSHVVRQMTSGKGADAVLMAATSDSDELVSQAAGMCRKRGKLVLIGVVGLNIRRADFYEKELSFQVSCSYGPGRYDSAYEQEGTDYPYAYVRWTEQRNFDAVLAAMASGRLRVKELVSETVPLRDFHRIYENIGHRGVLASLLKYDVKAAEPEKILVTANQIKGTGNTGIGMIGAGDFAASVLLPAMRGLDAPIIRLSSQKGLSAARLAKKYGIPEVTTDPMSIIRDNHIGGVIIATRHDSHAEFVATSLGMEKHVLVEKPLAITREQLDMLIPAIRSGKGSLTLGYNRRFSPAAVSAKKYFSQFQGPVQVILNMNAGFLPQDHWTQNMQVGGGRIVGEACHHVDLASFITGSQPVEVVARCLGPSQRSSDNVSMLIRYRNGSLATINYFSTGSKEYPKERIEIHQNKISAVLDNFSSLRFYGLSGRNWSGRQDKGHDALYRQWLGLLRDGGRPLFDPEELIMTSKVCFAALDSLASGEPVAL